LYAKDSYVNKHWTAERNTSTKWNVYTRELVPGRDGHLFPLRRGVHRAATGNEGVLLHTHFAS
ncbi:hypothetical protein HD554DRAFT_2030112, partial [Boletus coccyginus]